MSGPRKEFLYSEKYYDDKYEYRHVAVPSDKVKSIPRNHLLTETEWRNLGVMQSPNWMHYMLHGPEPHLLLFRKSKSGKTDKAVRASSNIQEDSQKQSCLDK